MRHESFELSDGRHTTRRPWHMASPDDRAEEAVAVAAALENGPSLEGRMYARYAGVLAGRRGADDTDLPQHFADEGLAGLAAAWRFGRQVAARAASQRARRTLDNADRMARAAAGRRLRKDLDG
jgi:hypothetical protein